MSAHTKTTDHKRQNTARKNEVDWLVHGLFLSLSDKNQ